MKACSLAVVALALAGCGTYTVPAALRQYESLHAIYPRLTARARAVSTDSVSLSRAVRAAYAAGVRSGAGRLRWDAWRLAREAWHVCMVLEGPARSARGAQGMYIRLERRVACDEWWEGAALISLSAALWHDPYMTDGRTTSLVKRSQHRAALAAVGAQRAAWQAGTLRRLRAGDLRYQISP